MTKSLGPFDYGKAPRSAQLQGSRRRSLVSFGLEALVPLVIVAIGFLIGRTFFGF